MVTTVFYIFKKLEELGEDEIKKTQIKFLKMKITITEMNITDGINSRFENAGKSEFEDIAIETTQ